MHHFLTYAHLLSTIRDLLSKHRTHLLHSLKPSSQRGLFPTFAVGGRLRLLAFVAQLLAWLGLTFEKNISREAGLLGWA
jgi:hypothetical protein